MVALLKFPRQQSLDDGANRRVFPRKEVHCRVQGVRMDHTISAHRSPYLSLATHDLSVGGLAAISDHALDIGERINVFFPPQGAQRGWDAQGRVIRCNQSPMGYRVAVEFDPLPIAA